MGIVNVSSKIIQICGIIVVVIAKNINNANIFLHKILF